MPDWLASCGPLALAAWVGLFFVANTLVGLAIGFGLERAMPTKRIWSDPLAPGQLRHELVGNLVFVGVTIATFTLLLSSGLVRFGEESGLRATGTFAALYLGFQAYFYGLHRTLHLPSLVRFHRWHHVSRVTTPLSGQSTSVVEALGWMGGYALLPLALSYVVPISFDGWAAYMVFNVVGNVVGHANVEVVPKAPGLRQRSLLATVFTYHALHHARWTGHYGFASTWADRLSGTEWPDWMPLYERVLEGRPLRLSEVRRVDDGAA